LLLTMNLPPRHFANCAISPTRAQTQVTVLTCSKVFGPRIT
jgi:hypothetical protein